MTNVHWVENYRLLVLRDPSEEPERQYIAIILERNIVGIGSDMAEAIESARHHFFADYDYQLTEGARRPEDDPDPELLGVYRNRKARVTPGGETILMRLRVKVTVTLDPLLRDEPLFADITAPPAHRRPHYEFEPVAVG